MSIMSKNSNLSEKPKVIPPDNYWCPKCGLQDMYMLKEETDRCDNCNTDYIIKTCTICNTVLEEHPCACEQYYRDDF